MARLFWRKKKEKEDKDAQALRLQSERIAELKEEIGRLQKELSALRARESNVLEEVEFCRRLSVDAEKEIRLRYTLEAERLDTFRKRWTGYVDGLKQESFGAALKEADERFERCRNEIARYIAEDFFGGAGPEADLAAERLRLEEEPNDCDPSGREEREEDVLPDAELKALLGQLIDGEQAKAKRIVDNRAGARYNK